MEHASFTLIANDGGGQRFSRKIFRMFQAFISAYTLMDEQTKSRKLEQEVGVRPS